MKIGLYPHFAKKNFWEIFRDFRYLYTMKVIITESQLKSIMKEAYDDYKMSAPRSKSISKISSKLNSPTIKSKFKTMSGGFGKGKPWSENPKYQTDDEWFARNVIKDKEKEKDVFADLQPSEIEKMKEKMAKEDNENRKLKMDKTKFKILDTYSFFGEADGEMKINDLIEKGELDSKTVYSIMDKIDKNKSLLHGFISTYEKDIVQEKINSYIRKGILDKDIVKYIISKLPKSKF